MVNTNISKSEKIVANTRVEKIVSKFEPPCMIQMFDQFVMNFNFGISDTLEAPLFTIN